MVEMEKYEEAYDHMAMQDGMTVRAEKYNKLRAENTRLREAIRWALGEADEWPAKVPGRGSFYWRKELRRRAALEEKA